ncbi:unnamed protein product, partial [Heterobilharzia americana]
DYKFLVRLIRLPYFPSANYYDLSISFIAESHILLSSSRISVSLPNLPCCSPSCNTEPTGRRRFTNNWSLQS